MMVYRKQKVLQPGEYEAKIVTVNERRSRRTGNEMLVVVLSVDSEEGSSVTLRDYLVFTETSIWKFGCFLQAIGRELEDGDEIDLDDFKFWRYTARVQIGVKEFEDGTFNYVERWLPKAKSTPATTSTPPAPQP